ncbi:MAG: recombinase family protein, partial [Hyphomicrobium sp.]|nr:recombinase family protein [Hyphomicrobium sp.]
FGMTIIGYAVATDDRKDFDKQLVALRDANCGQYAIEYIRDSAQDRPELETALAALHPGDQLVVQNFSRAATSHWRLVEIFQTVRSRGADLVSVEDGIDTSTAGGEHYFELMNALQRFDDGLLQSHGNGQQRPRGRNGGRKPVDATIYRRIADCHFDRSINVTEVCKSLNISRGTFYKYSNLIAAERAQKQA